MLQGKGKLIFVRALQALIKLGDGLIVAQTQLVYCVHSN